MSAYSSARCMPREAPTVIGARLAHLASAGIIPQLQYCFELAQLSCGVS